MRRSFLEPWPRQSLACGARPRRQLTALVRDDLLDHPPESSLLFQQTLGGHRFDGSSAHSDGTLFPGRFGFERLAFSCAATCRATSRRWNTGGACRTTVQQSFLAFLE